MSAGFHGNNSLDPSTSIHILKTYVIPILTYGLKVLIPDKKNITRLHMVILITNIFLVNHISTAVILPL
jgi:hypothetical protein